jgi:type II secretory ATPase GspE/PulE/Tfp pilus assembly ATPase PilB-like protein
MLVAGPTGSGKSTTLFGILKNFNPLDLNISTLEDPIEYDIEFVNQSQVQPSIGYTFSSGLRSLVRQDPDIIMVGEIRDKETATLAVEAALTGHLVLSTIHTNSAAGTVQRLINMGVEPFLLASAMKMVISQRLAKRMCQHCKEEFPIKESEI